jgi:hypothetical protein
VGDCRVKPGQAPGVRNEWIFFQTTLVIPITGMIIPDVLPPRGALEAFKCAGQPEAAPEMRRLAVGVFAGSTPAGPMRWPDRVLRGTG